MNNLSLFVLIREFLLFCVTETENIGKAHINAAHRMLEELDKSLKDFREQQREIRKKVSYWKITLSLCCIYVCMCLCCILCSTVRKL